MTAGGKATRCRCRCRSLGAVEGLDNMTDHHQPTIAATISRAFGTRLVLYTTPAFVWNTAAADFLEGHDEHDHDGVGEPEVVVTAEDNTLLLGLGGRLRLRPSVFVTGEFTPRLAGYDSGRRTPGASRSRRRPAATRCRSTSRTRSARPSANWRGSAASTTSISDSTSPVCSNAGTAAGGPFHREKSQCDE